MGETATGGAKEEVEEEEEGRPGQEERAGDAVAAGASGGCRARGEKEKEWAKP